MPAIDEAIMPNTAPSGLIRRIYHRVRGRHIIDSAPSDIAMIRKSGRFDENWYLDQYPDVAAAGMDPIEHYVRHGVDEGRNPTAVFDTKFYLRTNADVLRAGINPFRHYIEYGMEEGRPSIPSMKGKILTGPLVSVVIPVYEVETYLSACLDSVLQQKYYNLEIIIVDDGSTDGSIDIARAYAESDPRIRVFARENGGLGAARNTGVAASSGLYITFVDSDDILPPGAIACMVRSLQETGSDFAVGAIRRLRNGRLMPPDGWVKDVHFETRTRMKLEDFPKILTDVFACNKLFDVAFFRKHVGSFPEKIRYEDQEPTAKAYLGGVFDVLSETVYHWRIREDGTSITQRKSDPADLRDRLIVKQRVSGLLEGSSASVYEEWLVKAIGFDLRPYFEQVPRTDEKFFDQLRTGMQFLAKRMNARLWTKVKVVDRLPALAVLAGCRDDVGVAITRRAEYGYFVPGRLLGGEAYLDRKYLDGMVFPPPDELLKLGDADLSVVACASSLWWHGTMLRLEGHAYLANLEFTDDTFVSAKLVSEGRNPVDVPLQPRYSARIDHESRDAWNAHAQSGFAAEFDPVELGLDPGSIWRMEITVGCARLGKRYRTLLREADARGDLGTLAVSASRGGSRWSARFEQGFGFGLRCETSEGATITSISTGAGSARIRTQGAAGDTLVLTCKTRRDRIEVKGVPVEADQIEFRFELPDLAVSDGSEHIWHARLHGPDAPRSLVYPGDRDDLERASPEHHRVRAAMTQSGTLMLVQNSWWAVADEISTSPNAICIRGRIDAPGMSTLSVRMAGDTQELQADRVEFDHARQLFEARIPFDPVMAATGRRDVACKSSPVGSAESAQCGRPADGGAAGKPIHFMPTMLHGFGVRVSISLDGAGCERWLKVADRLQHDLPRDETGARYGLSFTRTPRAAALWVRLRPPYSDGERGRLAQHRLHDNIRQLQAASDETGSNLQNAILFESFGGRQISDSVLALCEEIIRRGTEMDLYWTVADMGMSVPEGTTPLLIHSREWMHLLHRARYLVNNNNFPFYFRKSPGQIYIQTWHGTPLKRIGNDVPSPNLSLPYRQLMVRESRYWDFLLAQNDYAAAILPRSFGFQGPVLNLGYPRNDALADSKANFRRLVVRNLFGFEPYDFVVLYAPTWRDNLSGPHGYSRVNYLDFRAVQAASGRNMRFILRGHHNTAKNPTVGIPGVIDATSYPDINDLLLASDLLVTDYSSVMFDYIVTGKPIVFLAPDIDQYRDKTRGFYIDLEEIAPGPVCRTNDELVNVMSNLGESLQTCFERYAEFASRFAPKDDGSASARVVDAIWGREQSAV